MNNSKFCSLSNTPFDMNHPDLLNRLRSSMNEAGIDACIIPSSDPHQNEYIPGHWQFRRWFSGFTGSAGTVVVTKDFAGLWTDSRYFIQAEQQLKGSGIELVKLKIPHTPEHVDWLADRLKKGSQVGIDGRFFSSASVKHLMQQLDPAGIGIQTDVDLLSPLWQNRPGLPETPVYLHETRFAGKSRHEKIAEVKTGMQKLKADLHLITTLDDIAWLLNLRGSDISFCPFFVSYCLVGTHDVSLFIDPAKVPDEVRNELESDHVRILPYDQVESHLRNLEPGLRLYLAPERVNYALMKAIRDGVQILEGMNITTGLKAIKNPVEIEGLRSVMKRDGIAWIRLWKWLEERMKSGQYPDEWMVAKKIAGFRSEQEGYLGESFHPISAWGWHGAVVHYSVTPEEALTLKPEGIFLLDTGGHFFQGTTDTTRTFALSEPDPQQKRDFTLALKGTLGVSLLRFPKGTKGFQMDILARKALWDYAMNYGHGTGHGVGFLLSVHEGPQTIGTSASGYMQVTMEPGMVTTVEPAIYREGRYGMRTENMTLVVGDETNEFGTFYRFETLTAVPIDLRLIDKHLLTPQEISWINDYHDWVFDTLTPSLSDDESVWLREKTIQIR